MATIVNGVIFIWSGTNASIPSGWERVTSMDGKYAKGTAASTDPNDTGGATTHTHTSPTHTHTVAAHTHTISIANNSQSASNITDTGSDGASGTHNHSSITSGAVSNATVESVAVTYSAVSNDPPYYEIIYITPTTTVTTVPTGAICLSEDTTITGFNLCDGNNSTPNLGGKYLKGAAASGDSGGTGGSTTNVHNINHTHTTSHQHAAASTGGAVGTVNSTVSGNSGLHQNHTHSITLPAATPTVGSGDTINLTTSETVEPAYTKLAAFQAPSALSPVNGMIAMWLGTLASIPTGWVLVDGTNTTVDMRGRHLKVTTTVGEIGNTGGANTHTHASQNHTHAGVAHTHSGSIGHTANTNGDGSGSQNYANSTGTHAISTNSVDIVLDTGSTTADSSSNEPPYRTVAFIQFIGQAIEVNLNDAFAVADTIVKNTAKTLVESVIATDAIATIRRKIIAYADLFVVTESFSKLWIAVRAFVDTIYERDTVRKFPKKVFADALGVTEQSFSIAIVRLLEFVDSVFVSENLVKKPFKIFKDTLDATDPLVKKVIKAFSESVSLTEAYFDLFVAKIFHFIESISVTESIVKKSIRSFVEDFSVSEVFSVVGTKIISLVDVVSVADSVRKFPKKVLSEIARYHDKQVKKYLNGEFLFWTHARQRLQDSYTESTKGDAPTYAESTKPDIPTYAESTKPNTPSYAESTKGADDIWTNSERPGT